jgi:hypothetical protein
MGDNNISIVHHSPALSALFPPLESVSSPVVDVAIEGAFTFFNLFLGRGCIGEGERYNFNCVVIILLDYSDIDRGRKLGL